MAESGDLIHIDITVIDPASIVYRVFSIFASYPKIVLTMSYSLSRPLFMRHRPCDMVYIALLVKTQIQ